MSWKGRRSKRRECSPPAETEETTGNKIAVRAVAQVRVDEGSTARVLILGGYPLSSTLRHVADAVSKRLRLHVLNNEPVVYLGLSKQPLPYAELPSYRLDELNDKPERGLDLTIDYSGGKKEVRTKRGLAKREKRWEKERAEQEHFATVGRFLHAISLKLPDGVTTWAEEAMCLVVRHFDSLLPDGHEHNDRFEADLKRLVTAVGPKTLEAHLPLLLPALIRVAEHASDRFGRCDDSVPMQREFAWHVLLFLIANYGGSLAPFTLHLETFAFRLLCCKQYGVKFGAELTPAILRLHMNQGDKSAAHALWRDFWPALKEEMQQAWPDPGYRDPTEEFLDAVAASIKLLGAEGISASEMHEIVAVIGAQLDWIRKGSEREVKETWYDRRERLICQERILRSCANLVRTGQEILGEAFIAIAAGLQPLLFPLIASYEWGKEAIEAISMPETSTARRYSSDSESSLKTCIDDDVHWGYEEWRDWRE